MVLEILVAHLRIYLINLFYHWDPSWLIVWIIVPWEYLLLQIESIEIEYLIGIQTNWNWIWSQNQYSKMADKSILIGNIKAILDQTEEQIRPIFTEVMTPDNKLE